MKKNITVHFFISAVIILFTTQPCFSKTTEDSLSAVLKNSPDSLKASTYLRIADENYKQGNYTQSIDFYKKSIPFYLKTTDQKAIIYALNLIGHSYIKQGTYNNALRNYLLALKLSEDLDDNDEMAKTLNNIGRYYGFLNDYEKSLSYHLRAIKIIELLDNNTEMKAKSLNNIGMCYGYLGEVDKSLEYFNQSLPLRHKLGNKEDISILLNNLGYAYSLKGDFNKAYEQLNTSLSICEEIDDKKGTTYALLNIAELQITHQKYNQAIPLLQRALKLALEVNSDILTQDSYQFLSEAYEKNGDTKNSLLYHKKFNTLQEKLLHEQLENKVGNVNLLNDLNQKKQEVEQLNKENRINELQLKTTWTTIYSLAALLIILTVFFIIFYFQKKELKRANKNLVFKNLEIVKNEARLKEGNTGKQISSDSSLKKSDSAKYQKSPLNQEQKNDILNKIIHEVEVNQLYLREDLTLIILSDIINTNKSYISQIINENFEKNFNTYINEYRIIAARNILSKEESWILTIEAIANSVGFKSISAFNTAFKKFTGITPSYFIETVKANSLDK